MKNTLKVAHYELYSFLHNLKALLFSIFALLISLSLISGIGLSSGRLNNISADESTYTSLKTNYEGNRNRYAYYVDYLDGKNPPLPQGGAGTADPSLYSFYVQQLHLYEYLLNNDQYLFITAFTLSNPDDPLYSEYQENMNLPGSSNYRAVVGVGSSVASTYFSLAFALVIGFLVFGGRHSIATRKNEANSPLSSQDCYKGKLLFSFLLITIINLLFFLLTLLLGLPMSFSSLFLVYSYGQWYAIPPVMIALCYFLVNEVLSLVILSSYGLFPRWTGKKRFLSLVILTGIILLSFGGAFLLSSFIVPHNLVFYFFPFVNLIFVPYAFYNWSFWVVFSFYFLLSGTLIILSLKKNRESFPSVSLNKKIQ